MSSSHLVTSFDLLMGVTGEMLMKIRLGEATQFFNRACVE